MTVRIVLQLTSQLKGPLRGPCFFCEQAFVVDYASDVSLSTRCQWLDANIYAHNELDVDELAPQAVEWAEGILASAGA
jgi:hypothetical protein